MAKKVDLKAKAKRQKIIAAVGGVLLLGVMAIQVPRTLNMMKGSPPPPPAAAAPAPGAVDPSVLPTPGSVSGSDGDTQASGGAGNGTLIDSEPPPAATTGQLVSFGRFKSKDPFAQQVVPVDNSANNDDQPASPAAGTKAGGTNPPSSSSRGPTAAAGSAVISVNGAQETVAVKADFPKDEPVFMLASISGGKAKIRIAGGAFASGSPTLTLEKGKPVTLVNTADGLRYELELISVG